MNRKKTIKLVFLSACALLLGLATDLTGAYLIIHCNGNFHEVDVGKVFRSAQLDASELTREIEVTGIKSILNLRGEALGDRWYDSELAVSRLRNVKHIDYEMSAGRPLNLDQMNEILDLIEKAPKPILIHCRGGSDRTGLVAAIYLANKNPKLPKVKEALSIRYGHLPILNWSYTAAMDRSLELFLQNVEGDHGDRARITHQREDARGAAAQPHQY